jgi:ATP-dependent DNA helicase RecG
VQEIRYISGGILLYGGIVISDPLTQSVTTLPGIGTYRAKALETAGIATVSDLMYYFPRRYLDRSTLAPIAELYRYLNHTVTTMGRVSGVTLVSRGKKRLIVTIKDTYGSMDLVFFQGIQYWQKAFEQDEMLAVSGTVAYYGNRPNMVHPEIDRLQDEETFEFINTGGIIPVYPSSAELERVGLNRHGGFRKLIHTVLQRHLKQVADHFDEEFRQKHKLIELQAALATIHHPSGLQYLDEARRRLIFDEFFLLSLRLAMQRQRIQRTETGISFRLQSPRARALVRALPFSLTGAQTRVIKEITQDMTSQIPMNRLLQGDVGSGKTVVALLAMLIAADNGFQSALMVPTEILAEQHYRTISSLLNDLSLNVVLLVGQQAAAKRALAYAMIENGSADLVIGTHALIESEVRFRNLGFVVIDEQHRFGVAQRAALRAKGKLPDILIMSATPIPRTLTMTLYGDLDVSVIDEMPANRKKIRTAIRFEDDRDKVWSFLRTEIKDGHQAYVVFPLVSESEKMDLKAATDEFESMRSGVFHDLRLGLLHGQMPPKEKDAIMTQFKNHEIDILVSTTVIEVGVDVPNATVMIIEHAERFGLAQLHQMRGRIGRGADQGYCILMTDKKSLYASKTGATDGTSASDAKRRLETMRDTLDGFVIAEVDMEIRGPGDMWSTQQSGFPELRIANILRDGMILQEARDAAFHIAESDPQLEKSEHAQLQTFAAFMIQHGLDIAETG